MESPLPFPLTLHQPPGLTNIIQVPLKTPTTALPSLPIQLKTFLLRGGWHCGSLWRMWLVTCQCSTPLECFDDGSLECPRHTDQPRRFRREYERPFNVSEDVLESLNANCQNVVVTLHVMRQDFLCWRKSLSVRYIHYIYMVLDMLFLAALSLPLICFDWFMMWLYIRTQYYYVQSISWVH